MNKKTSIFKIILVFLIIFSFSFFYSGLKCSLAGNQNLFHEREIGVGDEFIKPPVFPNQREIEALEQINYYSEDPIEPQKPKKRKTPSDRKRPPKKYKRSRLKLKKKLEHLNNKLIKPQGKIAINNKNKKKMFKNAYPSENKFSTVL